MISARNYAARAQAGILDVAKMSPDYKYKSTDDSMSRTISDLIGKSVHFAIPDNGEIFDDNLRGLVGIEAMLPYPFITLEYYVDGSRYTSSSKDGVESPRRVALASQVKKEHVLEDIAPVLSDCPIGFLWRFYDNIRSFCDYSPCDYFIQVIAINEIRGLWMIQPMSLLLPSSWDYALHDSDVMLLSEPIFGQANDAQKFCAAPLPIMPGRLCSMTEKVGIEYAMRCAIHDASGEARAILELCEALSCSNVTTDIIQEENKKANIKRVKNGKLPIYETKTLSIIASRSSRRPTGATYIGRSSPRQHLRRGHVRVLHDNRRVWVNSCSVGSISTGLIDKSYSVRSPEARR